MSDSWRGAPPPDRRLDDAASAAGPFTFPWDAPLFPPFPMQFRDASILTVCYRTDPAAIERLLPPPLDRVGDVVVAHIYRMPDVDFAGCVHECNVMVGARLVAGGESVTGGYSVGLYLDSDAGVAHGREVHGQPKKLAKLVLETRGDLIVGEVERNGITILTATTPFKQQRAAPAEMRRHFDFAENINYKVIPHIDGTPAIRQLTSRRLQDLDVSECWVGPCTGRAAAERSGPALPAAGARAARRVFLARQLHACRGTRAPRLPGAVRVSDSTCSVVVATGVLTDLEVETAHLRGRPVDLRLSVLDTPEQVARETAAADAVVVTIEPLPRASIEQLGPGVRIIARAGIGLDAIDLVAAKERGIAVFHTPDYATEEVATHTVALILALNRKLLDGDRVARTEWRAWSQLKPIKPLSELTVGVVGLGRIGRAVIDRLRPFTAAILGFDPYTSDTVPGVETVATLDELLRRCDVLTLHVPLTDETRGLIGARELALLRPGAVVVNVARGALIDQKAVASALHTGHLSGAGLDVLVVEPPDPGDPILTAPGVILSPHFAWYSQASNRRMREMALDGLLDYLAGREPSVGRVAVRP